MAAVRVPTLTIPIESKANVEAKALRILLERRLTVLHVKGPRIYAECRGTDTLHHLGFDRGSWWCHCPEPKGKCAHLRALQMVTVRPDD